MASILHASPASITAASSSLCSKGQVWGGNAQQGRRGAGRLPESGVPQAFSSQAQSPFPAGGPDWLSLTPKAGLFSPSSLSHLFTRPRIHSKCAKQLESPYQAPWLC